MILSCMLLIFSELFVQKQTSLIIFHVNIKGVKRKASAALITFNHKRYFMQFSHVHAKRFPFVKMIGNINGATASFITANAEVLLKSSIA